MRDIRPGSRRTGERDQRRAEYAHYMGSPQWFERRRRWDTEQRELTGTLPTCVGCEQRWRVGADDLHHCDYERLGNEAHEDLWAMCRACHTQLHRLLDGQKYARGVSYRQRNVEALGALRAVRSEPASASERLRQLRKFL